METVPGLIATQHSGEGKANQYFLRGFNLDHGTDFNGSVDAVPVNLRSHGHGQGYSDFNFIIPEFIERIDHCKGPYYADVADFSAAGTAALTTKSRIDAPFVEASAGMFGYFFGQSRVAATSLAEAIFTPVDRRRSTMAHGRSIQSLSSIMAF